MDIQTNTSPKSLTNRRRLKLTLTIGLINIAVIAGVSIHIWRLSHAATTYVAPTSINSTCARDVTADLNSWIASVPNGNRISFRAGACYAINATVMISGRSGLDIDGLGATFKALTSGRELPALQARTRDQFLIKNSDNISLKNLIVRGANPSAGTSEAAYVAELEAQHAFDISSSTNITLDSVQAYDVYGDFVYLGQQGGSQPSGVVIKNSRFERNGRQGVGIAAGKNVTIENNTMVDTRRSDIDLESNTTAWNIENITIRNNSFGAGRLLFIANGGSCGTVKNIVVENNTLTNRAMSIITTPNATCATKRGPYRIVGNRSTVAYGTNAQAAMQFHQVSGLVVSNNTQPMQEGRNMNLVRTYDSTDVKVTGNTLLSAVGPVLYGADTTNVCHSNNYIGNPLRLEASNAPCPSPPVPPPPAPDPTPVDPPPVNNPPEDEISNEVRTPPTPPASPASAPSAQATASSLNLGKTTEPGDITTDAVVSNAKLKTDILQQRWSQQPILQKISSAFFLLPAIMSATITNPSSIYTILSDEQKRTSLMIAGGLLIGLGSLIFALYDVLRRKQKVKKLDKTLSPAPIKPAKSDPEVDSDQDNTLPPPANTSNS